MQNNLKPHNNVNLADILKSVSEQSDLGLREYRRKIIEERAAEVYEFPLWNFWMCGDINSAGAVPGRACSALKMDARKVFSSSIDVPPGIKNWQVDALNEKNKGVFDLLPHDTDQLYVTCTQVKSLPDLGRLKKLRHLKLEDFTRLSSLEFIRQNGALRSLVLSGVRNLPDLSALSGLKHLSMLELSCGMSGGMPVDVKIESFDFLKELKLEMLRLERVRVLNGDVVPICDADLVKRVEFPNTLFSREQLAQIAAAHKNIHEQFRKPRTGWSGCPKCGAGLVAVLGKARYVQYCPGCELEKIQKVISEFDDLVRRFKFGWGNRGGEAVGKSK